MPFDLDRYLSTDFRPRMDDVPVPTLKDFFGDAPAVWKVRGLTANESARAREAQEKRSKLSALADAMLAGSHRERVDAIKESLGLGDDVHADVARRMEILVAGSVDPPCSLDLAVRVAQNHAEVFYSLTNQIIVLTGQGAEDASKKPVPSGEAQKSEPA